MVSMCMGLAHAQAAKPADTEAIAKAQAFITANDLKIVSRYIGTIIGYSKYCKYDADSIKLIEKHFLSNTFGAGGLTLAQQQEIKKEFYDTVKNVEKNGVPNVTHSCSQFKTEFEKIIGAIKGSAVSVDITKPKSKK